MIGFYDLDIHSQKGLGIPNVEIMRLASYYEKEEGQFCRLLLPDESFEGYDKIFVFSENVEHEKIPLELRKQNIIVGGTGFTNGVYIPFKNKIAEYSLPTIQIYKNYLSKNFTENIKPKEVSDFLDSCYYRCYAGADKLPIPRMIKGKKVYLYDRDFFYDDWEMILLQLSKRKPSNIIRIHPVYCNTLTQFFTLRNYPKFSRSNEIILNLDIPCSQFNALFNRYNLKFKADITKDAPVMLPLGNNFITTKEYYENLVYILNFLYSFWSNGIMIKLHYEHEVFNPIEDLCKAIVKWAALGTPKKQSQTIFESLKYAKGNKDAIDRQLTGLLEYNKSWEILFKQNFNDLKKRGYWRC